MDFSSLTVLLFGIHLIAALRSSIVVGHRPAIFRKKSLLGAYSVTKA